MAFVLKDEKGHVVYLFFKRDWLHSYGVLFPWESWKGWGQTVNYGLLKRAASEGAFIVVVTPDSEGLPVIYAYGAKEWLDYAEQHNTIRKPSAEVGEEASIPANFLVRQSI